MKKLIFKIIDLYYIEKFKEFLDNELLWYKMSIDYEIEETSLYISIKAKKKKYKDSLYQIITIFTKKNTFNYLLNQSYIKDHIKNMINYYLDNN